MAVFRAHSSVNSCDLILDDEENTLTFILHCKLGVEKKYVLAVEDSVAHKAVYNKVTPNRIVAKPRTLQDCVNNFHSSVEEITLVPLPHQVKLKSFVDESVPLPRGGKPGDASAVLMTELVMDVADFELFSIRPGAQELTFSLKELRAILGLCENLGASVSICFSDPGAPILWTVTWFENLVVDFVLATLASVSDASQQTPSQPFSAITPVSGASSLPGSNTNFLSSSNNNQAQYDEDDENDEDDNDHNNNNNNNNNSDDSDSFIPGTPEREAKRSRLYEN
jgi:hypothetical protein